jgi:hypothetical protein
MITGAAMLSTVGFDDESRFDASKIHYIRRNRMLPSEAPAELVLSERIQKQPLRVRRVPPQTASASDHRGTASHDAKSPLSVPEKLPHLAIAASAVSPHPNPPPRAGREFGGLGFALSFVTWIA